MKLMLVAGARRNFMKIAPSIRALLKKCESEQGLSLNWKLVHTGQHMTTRCIRPSLKIWRFLSRIISWRQVLHRTQHRQRAL